MGLLLQGFIGNTTIVYPSVTSGNCSFPDSTGIGTQYATCCHSVVSKEMELRSRAMNGNQNRTLIHASANDKLYSTYTVACGGKHTYLVETGSKEAPAAEPPETLQPELVSMTFITCGVGEKDCQYLHSIQTASILSFESKYEASKTLSPEDYNAFQLMGRPFCENVQELSQTKAPCLVNAMKVDLYYSPLPVKDLCAPLPPPVTAKAEYNRESNSIG